MIVVPVPLRAGAARHPLLGGLLVTDAGHFSRALGHRVEREKGADTHLVILCMCGVGWVKMAGSEFVVKAGDLIWLPAGRGHTYGADEKDPWSITWVHFLGAEAGAWHAHLGKPGPLLHLPPDRLGEMKLDAVYAWLERGYGVEELIGAGIALRSALAAAAQLWRVQGSLRSAAERVAEVQSRLRSDPARHYCLRDLADGAGLSVPHFSQIFRKQTGYSPIDYLIRARIQRACRLLDGTALTVAEIAKETGYEDAYYFARSFRRVMALSPRAYRKSVKG